MRVLFRLVERLAHVRQAACVDPVLRCSVLGRLARRRHPHQRDALRGERFADALHLAVPLPRAHVLGGAGDPTARLQRAREMRDQGLITDAEYETIKARIVGSL